MFLSHHYVFDPLQYPQYTVVGLHFSVFCFTKRMLMKYMKLCKNKSVNSKSVQGVSPLCSFPSNCECKYYTKLLQESLLYK